MKSEKIISNWAEALFLAQEKKPGKEREKILERLAAILKKTKKEHLLGKILEKFGKIFQRENKVELIFARNQSHEFSERMEKKLSGIFGQDKEIETKTDEDIIGGFRIKTANVLIRASIRDFLNDFKNLWKR